MNNPSAIITSTTVLEISHSVSAYLFATTLVVMGYVAWRIWRSKTTSQFPHWLIGRLALVGIILLVIVAELGHQSAVDLATTQPTKLAGMELLDKTQTNAPFRIGGAINQDGKTEGGIVLPGVLSLLSGYSLDYEVRGLDEVARDKWPMLVIHTIFDSKMALVGITSLIMVLTLFFYWRKKRQPKWFIKVLAIFGAAGIVMVELGWMITELGRQPYAIAGKLLTADAFTKNVSALQLGYIFPVMFILLFAAMFFALYMVTKRWRKQENSEW
jgi:cytochrome d ubiquinol oxidase subunit I